VGTETKGTGGRPTGGTRLLASVAGAGGCQGPRRLLNCREPSDRTPPRNRLCSAHRLSPPSRLPWWPQLRRPHPGRGPCSYCRGYLPDARPGRHGAHQRLCQGRHRQVVRRRREAAAAGAPSPPTWKEVARRTAGGGQTPHAWRRPASLHYIATASAFTLFLFGTVLLHLAPPFPLFHAALLAARWRRAHPNQSTPPPG
jgi:hypothetical protein